MEIGVIQQPCEIIRHKNQIHELIFHEASPAAFEAASEKLQRILAKHEHEPIRIALNISHVGTHPIVTINQWVQALFKAHGATVFNDLRVAFIYDMQVLASVSVWFSVFASLPSKMIMSFFTLREHHQALDWLATFK
jgi:hypothetical protein